MAQWTFVDPNTLLPGSPWTSAQAQAAFENLEAVTEGADNAPRVRGSAVRHNLLGEFDITSSVSAPVAFTNLDSHFGIAVVATDVRAFGSDTNQSLFVQVSNNNGGSWTTAFLVPASANQRVFAHIDFGPVSSFYAGATDRTSPDINDYIADRFTFTGPCNAVRFQVGGDSPVIAPGVEGDGLLAVYGLVRERE